MPKEKPKEEPKEVSILLNDLMFLHSSIQKNERAIRQMKLKRGELVFRLRSKGSKLRDIAENVGVSHQTVMVWERYYFRYKP